MSAPEHIINQGDTGPIVDSVLFPTAVNLTAAAVQLVYIEFPDGEENVVRPGTIKSAGPSTAAATYAEVQRFMNSEDTALAGFFLYQWVITLANGDRIIRPNTAPTDEFPHREKPCFQIVESLSPTEQDDDEGEGIMASNRALVVADTVELKALPAPHNSNYQLVIVMSDENSMLGTFEFDENISADSGDGLEYVLTAGGGGFRRKGV